MIVHGETDRETIERTARSLGIPAAEARHLLAVARGEVSGNYAVAERTAVIPEVRVLASRRKVLRQSEAKAKAKARKIRDKASRAARNPTGKVGEPELV